MAYVNQIKCSDCGISIPFMPEDATEDELLCDACLDKQEGKTGEDENDGNVRHQSNLSDDAEYNIECSGGFAVDTWDD